MKAKASKQWARARARVQARRGARLGRNWQARVARLVAVLFVLRTIRPIKAASLLHPVAEYAAIDAKRLEKAAVEAASRCARKIEESSGIPLEPSEVEEFKAIYRHELGAVYSRVGFFPRRNGSRQTLWTAKGCAVYRAAMDRAKSKARSYHYGKGAEEVSEFVQYDKIAGEGKPGESKSDKASFQLLKAYSAGRSCVGNLLWDSGKGNGMNAAALLRLRASYQDDRLRLAVYWENESGKEWKRTLERKLSLLHAVYESKRGNGAKALVDLGFEVKAETVSKKERKWGKGCPAKSALAQAIERLHKELIGGEIIIQAADAITLQSTLEYIRLISRNDVGPKAFQALANGDAWERLLDRVGVQEGEAIRPISAEGIADRVAKRRACLRRVSRQARLLQEGSEKRVPRLLEECEHSTIIPRVACVRAKSKAVAGYTLQLTSTLPNVSASEARGHACKLSAYALRLIGEAPEAIEAPEAPEAIETASDAINPRKVTVKARKARKAIEYGACGRNDILRIANTLAAIE